MSATAAQQAAHIRRFDLEPFEATLASRATHHSACDEAERRRVYWLDRLDAHQKRQAAGRVGYWIAGVLIAASIMVGQMAWLFVVLAAAYVIWDPVKSRRLDRVRAQLTGGQCPRCKYDLRGHESPESPLGPSRCSECGTPWPLIPPALPRSDNSNPSR